jgi:hypothetical protein
MGTCVDVRFNPYWRVKEISSEGPVHHNHRSDSQLRGDYS